MLALGQHFSFVCCWQVPGKKRKNRKGRKSSIDEMPSAAALSSSVAAAVASVVSASDPSMTPSSIDSSACQKSSSVDVTVALAGRSPAASRESSHIDRVAVVDDFNMSITQSDQGKLEMTSVEIDKNNNASSGKTGFNLIINCNNNKNICGVP